MKTGNLKHPLTVEHGPNSSKPRFATCSETRIVPRLPDSIFKTSKWVKAQQKNTLSRFKSTRFCPSLVDVALGEAFKRGFELLSLQRIYALPTMPTTLVEWKEWSRKLDRQYREAQIFQKATRPAPANNSILLAPPPRLKMFLPPPLPLPPPPLLVPLSNKNPKLMLRSLSRERASVIFVDLLIIGRTGALNARRKGQNIRVITQDVSSRCNSCSPIAGFSPKSIRNTSAGSGFCK